MVDQLHLAQIHEREQLRADVYRGRQLAHAIRNDLALVVGTLSLLGEDLALRPDQRADVAAALASLDTILTNVEALHALVRALAPETLA